MKILLIYLLIGVIVTWLIDLLWDQLDASFDLTFSLRIQMIFIWPLLVLAFILGVIVAVFKYLLGIEDEDNNTDDNNTIGPGYGT